MKSWLLGGLILASTLNSIAEAALAPSTPEPGTVWKAGEENEIIWGNASPNTMAACTLVRILTLVSIEEDGVKPTIKQGWQNFKIGTTQSNPAGLWMKSAHVKLYTADLMTGDNMDQKFLTNVATVNTHLSLFSTVLHVS